MTEEVEYVEECPQDDCDARFVGATPDDVREHLTEEHHRFLGGLIVFPTPEAREEALGDMEGDDE